MLGSISKVHQATVNVSLSRSPQDGCHPHTCGLRMSRCSLHSGSLQSQTWWWCPGRRWSRTRQWQLWYKPGSPCSQPGERTAPRIPEGRQGKSGAWEMEKYNPKVFKLKKKKTTKNTKNRRGGNSSKLTLRGQHYSDTKTRQRYHTKKDNYRPIPLMNTEQKSSTKYQETKFNKTIKVSHTMIKWELLQGCKIGSTSRYQCDIPHLQNKG